MDKEATEQCIKANIDKLQNKGQTKAEAVNSIIEQVETLVKNTVKEEEKNMELIKAEQQFFGWHQGRQGDDAGHLAISMALSKQEYKQLIESDELNYLTKQDHEDIKRELYEG